MATGGQAGSVAEAATAVVGGTVVTEAGVFEGTVLISPGGTISGLVSPGVPVAAAETLDVSGLHVFPGGVDTHSHFNDPGLTESEDFLTGTSGAAAGGYTTVLEMPQTLPLVDSVETFLEKLDAVRQKAVVDFGLYCALVPRISSDEDALDQIAKAGAIGLKGFVCDTPEMPQLSASQLARGLQNANRVGLRVAIHAESQAIIDINTERLRREGVPDPYAVAGAHPVAAEEEAVRMVLTVAKAVGGSIHLVHLTDPATVRLASQAKSDGVDVSIETCPHYLALTREDMKASGGWGLCYPPLRTKEAVNGLWTALKLGQIDAIGSDHCAYRLEEKVASDPWQVLPGITGVQYALPVLVHEALQRGVPLSAVARAFSANPARNFSLYPKKGDIRPGADADLVLVDINSEITARAEDMFTRCPGTVYEGMTFGARVRRTMVRGRTTYVDEGRPEIVVPPGSGMFLNGNEMRHSPA